MKATRSLIVVRKSVYSKGSNGCREVQGMSEEPATGLSWIPVDRVERRIKKAGRSFEDFARCFELGRKGRKWTQGQEP